MCCLSELSQIRGFTNSKGRIRVLAQTDFTERENQKFDSIRRVLRYLPICPVTMLRSVRSLRLHCAACLLGCVTVANSPINPL